MQPLYVFLYQIRGPPVNKKAYGMMVFRVQSGLTDEPKI